MHTHFFQFISNEFPITLIINIPLIQLLAFDLGLITLIDLNQYLIDYRNINLGQGIKFLTHRDDQ